MKKHFIYVLELFLFISAITFNILVKSDLLLKISIIIISVLYLLEYGLQKDNSYLKPLVTRIVISCLLSFLIVVYSIGLFTGFNNTILKLNFSYLFNVVFLQFVTIILLELMRYGICKNSANSKKPIILFTIVMIVLNVVAEINGYNLNETEGVFIFICVVLLPVISRELLCSYLAYKVSYLPSLIFKLVITLYQFVLPIIPNLGYYLYASFNLFLAYFIYFLSSKSIDYAEKTKTYVNKSTRKIIFIPLLILLLIIVVLVSGLFKYKMIAIGSNSMEPAYSRGDAVIYSKAEASEVVKDDILVFVKNKVVVTHRIVKITGSGNEILIQTKGDANNTPDSFTVNSGDVLGIVKYKVKYIGFPTIWINELFEGREIND